VKTTQGKLAVKLKEAAAMLSMSERTLRQKIKDREIAVCRATRHITIAVAELERFLTRNTVER
jgi:excisionase family DNA binding protein